MILAAIRESFVISRDAEITVEANPDDISLKKLDNYLGFGINRLSIGVQSFIDEILKFLNRRHDAEKAAAAVKNAAGQGYRADMQHGHPVPER